ncbi:uncharacterized protein PAC_05502 [Phialocephala subalpina]|uniref:Uncharacterized protein n=1 Tax=Phialocephala subalpina TaxID=576137 RepID=A0A1L7WS62_9HELO|nr:uncharacterized protein PAC_05502 [Phialocephala subalpina]
MVKPNDTIALIILLHILICVLVSICLYRLLHRIRSPPSTNSYPSSKYPSEISIEDGTPPPRSPPGRIHIVVPPPGNINVNPLVGPGNANIRPPVGGGNVNVRPGRGAANVRAPRGRGAANVRPGGGGAVNVRPPAGGGGAVKVRHD